MNVLGIAREADPTALDGPAYYRSYLPLREVNRQAEGIEARMVAASVLEDCTDDMLSGVDIITMARMYHEDCEEFIAEVHRRGGVLVLDSDDDLTETYKLVSGRGEEFKQVLGMVDHVTTSTQPLADLFSQYTQRGPVVLQNHVDSAWMRAVANPARRLTDELTIGFTGSPTHWGDWRLPAVPFAAVLRDYSVRGILHGEVPRYLTFTAQDLIRIDGVPYVIYPIVLSQFDIVLCAVDIHDEFNVGKSAIKALECMALGIVPICSQFGPYLELAKAGAPVVVVAEESQDGWFEAMRDVVRESEWREWLAAQGPAWVAEHRDMVNGGWEQWAEFYRSIK